MTKYKKIIITLIAIIVAIPVIGGGLLYFKLNSMYVPDEKSKKEEGKEEGKKSEENKDITNILLAGVDGTNIDKGNRSDSMMILTIDNKYKSIKLTSLARDTYVDIPGYSTEKLTHAHAYEGTPLLLDTIENNFKIKVDKYITVNFNSFIDIVDVLGGIDVNITSNDLSILNNTIPGCYKYDTKENKGPVKLIEGTGIKTLNGYQALAFSRIRYQDSAYARDGRQREVIEACLKKTQSKGLDEYIKILDVGINNMKTNISPTEMISLGCRVLKIGTNEVKQLEFPVYKDPATLDGKGWVIRWDKEKNLEVLNNFIFKNADFKQGNE